MMTMVMDDVLEGIGDLVSLSDIEVVYASRIEEADPTRGLDEANIIAERVELHDERPEGTDNYGLLLSEGYFFRVSAR